VPKEPLAPRSRVGPSLVGLPNRAIDEREVGDSRTAVVSLVVSNEPVQRLTNPHPIQPGPERAYAGTAVKRAGSTARLVSRRMASIAVAACERNSSVRTAHAVTNIQVVGSSVASMTSVSIRPPSESPITSRRSSRCGRSWMTAQVGHNDMPVAQKLLGLLTSDTPCSELAERDVGREQLVNRFGHTARCSGATGRTALE